MCEYFGVVDRELGADILVQFPKKGLSSAFSSLSCLPCVSATDEHLKLCLELSISRSMATSTASLLRLYCVSTVSLLCLYCVSTVSLQAIFTVSLQAIFTASLSKLPLLPTVSATIMSSYYYCIILL
ncbi:hypothetical protein EDC96DRAFT_546885 [Choanephora cucurbitarum]|nr:hypothetical protein EDC96DRAFT_546885 [Choanephora cucurbitarum]